VAGLDPAIQPRRVGAAKESFRSLTLATGWPALRPAMVTKFNPGQASFALLRGEGNGYLLCSCELIERRHRADDVIE